MYHNYRKAATAVTCTLLVTTLHISTALAQRDTTAQKITMPADGKLINDKPIGQGWVNMLDLKKLNLQPEFWKLNNGVLHGDCSNQTENHNSYSKKIFSDFEVNILVKMGGDENANSGVCLRVHPDNFSKATGYQIDMAKGAWGSLSEEGRAGMLQRYPGKASAKLIKANDYNHYYIKARGHHIEAWLNGVKTVDSDYEGAFLDGNIGIQLARGPKHTTVDVKGFYVRELNL
ncbi:DUF1080 domain-containing protein [Mucilaginibacter panaciglaebae]|uniref:3-keto-alpha-glucoside-1,2-lyase/3-keto-2-hydroxy-glucal hydratase domain-containing protein n=1 Tax=Mucilaginibacter panaciglaebae TaxID=502331 RepID=A0ABP7WPB2_9SPHI